MLTTSRGLVLRLVINLDKLNLLSEVAMKNLVKKSAVALAVASSLMVSGVASADSLLAPLVVGIDGGEQTYFSIKMRGNGAANHAMASKSPLHYVWFKKGTTGDDLYNLSKPCDVSSSTGYGSPWDMIYQRAVVANPGGTANLAGPDSFMNTPLGGNVEDKSSPKAYSAGNFVGFVTITDMQNVNADPAVKNLSNEGEISGFAYVVDTTNSAVMDYKLLNNHRSKVEGDFDAGFISKKSVDFSWMPTAMAHTEWLTVAISDDMSKNTDSSGSYDATVLLSQNTLSGSLSPQIPTGNQSGAYNHDEVVVDGGKNLKVTCMGKYVKGAFLNAHQDVETEWGGWKRMSIADTATTSAGVATSSRATGAITYKSEFVNFAPFDFVDTNGDGIADGFPGPVDAELFYKGYSFQNKFLSFFGRKGTHSIMGKGPQAAVYAANQSDAAELFEVGTPVNNLGIVTSFQVETSGHLSASPEAHPNRPY